MSNIDKKCHFDRFFQKNRKAKKKEKIVIEFATSIQLNERFRQIFVHIELKRFAHFNKVQQWIDVEQKTMIRQLIFVITSLFFEKRDAIIHCARTMMNFVFLAQYVSHDENTLRRFRVNASISIWRSIWRSKHIGISAYRSYRCYFSREVASICRYDDTTICAKTVDSKWLMQSSLSSRLSTQN